MVQAPAAGRELSLQGSIKETGRQAGYRKGTLFPTTATTARLSHRNHLHTTCIPRATRPRTFTHDSVPSDTDTSSRTTTNSDDGFQRHLPDSEPGSRRLHDPRRDRTILALDKRVSPKTQTNIPRAAGNGREVRIHRKADGRGQTRRDPRGVPVYLWAGYCVSWFVLCNTSATGDAGVAVLIQLGVGRISDPPADR